MMAACQSKSEKTDDVAETGQSKVEALHDELMKPYMEIGDLKEQVRRQVAGNAGLKAQADSVLGMLNVAEEGMNTWMTAYRPDTLQQLDATSGKNYLKLQMDEMLKLREQIETAHTRAHQFLGTPADHR